jgi:hypothetical protein
VLTMLAWCFQTAEPRVEVLLLCYWTFVLLINSIVTIVLQQTVNRWDVGTMQQFLFPSTGEVKHGIELPPKVAIPKRLCTVHQLSS